MSKHNQAVTTQKDELSQRALAIATEAQERSAALQELGVEAQDLVIPLIQVMQNTSALVGDDKAKLGDIVNMQTNEILGDGTKSVKILPLKLFKTLRTYDVRNKGFKFLSEAPLTSENDKLQGEGMVGEIPVKHYPTFNYFVLLKTDLAKEEGFPCLIRFKSTGMNAGRTLATHLYKLVFFRKRPYSQFVELSTKKEKKDTATYAVPTVECKSEMASEKEMAAAETMLGLLAAGNYRVDEREETEVGAERVEAAKPVVVTGQVLGKAEGKY